MAPISTHSDEKQHERGSKQTSLQNMKHSSPVINKNQDKNLHSYLEDEQAHEEFENLRKLHMNKFDLA